jgi:hypothetical protein
LFCAALDTLFTQSTIFAQPFLGGLWEWWEIKAAELAFGAVLQIPSIAQRFFRKLFSDQPPMPQPLRRLSTFPSRTTGTTIFYLYFLSFSLTRRGATTQELKPVA